MMKITIEQLQRRIKTHSERSEEDRSAVATLKAFLTPGGQINDTFSSEDKWPNTDGIFELVPNPELSRCPKQNFVVQIKGTNSPRTSAEGVIKYQLDLAFPAYVAKEVTLDPGIIFLVLYPNKRNQQRVFWKYLSSRYIASIDFNNDSAVIDFTSDDEIENTDESV